MQNLKSIPSKIIARYNKKSYRTDIGEYCPSLGYLRTLASSRVSFDITSRDNIYRILTVLVYRKIFGTSSYGEGCTSFITFFIIYRCNSLRLVVIIPCITKSFRPFILPQKTSKPLLTAVMHDINAHAKPRLLARKDKQR